MFLVACLLGLVQGLTEFIPVSSSGHLVLFNEILGTGQNHLFLEFINIGTVLALLVYFRKTIWNILKSRDWRLMGYLLIICIPAGLVGVLLGDFIDSSPFFMSPWTVMVAMAGIGLLMILAEKLPRLARGDKLNWKKSLFIGSVQTLAIIPGVSRSGSTILAGKTMGLSDENAAKYSFLASIPLMAGVCLRLLVSSEAMDYFTANWQFVLLSNLVAFISGLLAIKFLLKILSRKGSLRYFGYYRVALVAILLAVMLVMNLF